MSMTVTYPVKRGIYVNMTNRCPCACTFCLRQNGPGVYGSDPLWLEREPTAEEVWEDLCRRDLGQYEEVIFCGYGEPTERLDDLLEVARRLKENCTLPVRLNTNGLSDLIWGKPTAPLLAGRIDVVSVSLNAVNAEEYLRLTRSRFGLASFDAMLRFTEECTRYVPRVVMTVVGEPITSPAQQELCRKICADVGAELRVRTYEG